MKQLVIMPGGFHPFHAGHQALYDAARRKFPQADVYIAATDDTSTRPFPFAVKEKLARLAGVDPDRFVRVKSPFRVEEITQQYDPRDTVLIFVRSEKDRNKPPRSGGIKRDSTPAYLQPLDDNPKPMNQHGYMTYLPTVKFGPGLTSATEIRTAWPTLNDRRKLDLVMSLYPRTQGNRKLADIVVKLLDHAITGSVEENQGWAATYNEQAGQMSGTPTSGLMALYQRCENQSMAEDYINEASWSKTYKRSINCNNPKGFSQRAHCAGRRARQSGKKTKSHSVIEQALQESRLSNYCEIRTNFPDADFWLIRSEAESAVGCPVREFNPKHIGIKVTAQDRVDPSYLYYAMLNIYNQGLWKNRSYGATNLKNIRSSDVQNIPID
jgi:hypothetical protein